MLNLANGKRFLSKEFPFVAK